MKTALKKEEKEKFLGGERLLEKKVFDAREMLKRVDLSELRKIMESRN